MDRVHRSSCGANLPRYLRYKLRFIMTVKQAKPRKARNPRVKHDLRPRKTRHIQPLHLLSQLGKVFFTGWTTIPNPESLSTRSRNLPGRFPSDETDILSQMLTWIHDDAKISYKLCQNRKPVLHWVHSEDGVGRKCFKCAKTQLRWLRKKPKPVSDADEQLKHLRFHCLQNFTEKGITQSLKTVGNPVLLKVGSTLVLRRFPSHDVCGEARERFAQIPIVANGTLAEICMSICHYYRQRVPLLANGQEYLGLNLQGIFKLDDNHYGCMVSVD